MNTLIGLQKQLARTLSRDDLLKFAEAVIEGNGELGINSMLVKISQERRA